MHKEVKGVQEGKRVVTEKSKQSMASSKPLIKQEETEASSKCKLNERWAITPRTSL